VITETLHLECILLDPSSVSEIHMSSTLNMSDLRFLKMINIRTMASYVWDVTPCSLVSTSKT
jgi:hypothetical protein